MVSDEQPAVDVLGLALEAALQRLAAGGLTDVQVVETSPPRGTIPGARRVVRQCESAGRVELVVAAFPELQSELQSEVR